LFLPRLPIDLIPYLLLSTVLSTASTTSSTAPFLAFFTCLNLAFASPTHHSFSVTSPLLFISALLLFKLFLSSSNQLCHCKYLLFIPVFASYLKILCSFYLLIVSASHYSPSSIADLFPSPTSAIPPILTYLDHYPKEFFSNYRTISSYLFIVFAPLISTLT
jgi:hypothetical protein